MTPTAAALLAHARRELRKLERDVGRVRRLVASAADALENETTTDTRGGTPDEHDHEDPADVGSGAAAAARAA